MRFLNDNRTNRIHISDDLELSVISVHQGGVRLRIRCPHGTTVRQLGVNSPSCVSPHSDGETTDCNGKIPETSHRLQLET